VMFGETDLNSEIADCWKLVWNVEPAALMVPLALLAEELLEDEPPDELLLPEEADDEPDEEQAARAIVVAMAATPKVATCLLRPCCISGYSLGFQSVPGARD
jgi:hypothetical protein